MTKKSKSTLLGEEYKKRTAGTKPGTGVRFKIMMSVLSKKGAKNPGALTAWIGRKKYGAKQMAIMSAEGKKK